MAHGYVYSNDIWEWNQKSWFTHGTGAACNHFPKKMYTLTRSHHPLSTCEKRRRFWMFLVTIFRSNDQIIQAPTVHSESLGFSHSNASDPQAPHHRQQKRMKIAPNLLQKQIKRVSSFGGQKKPQDWTKTWCWESFLPSKILRIWKPVLVWSSAFSSNKTSWSFGAPKIPQSPFCQKVRKI